jgi:glycosyltransferase involved in cell wall biosynthesis
VAALPAVPGAELVVAGNDEEGLWPRLARQAAELGVAGRLRWIGPVAGADKAALLRGAALLVLPSRSENFGNVVLEAMAVGCPVVVTPEVGLAPAVAEAGAGRVVEGDPEPLAAALTELLADADGRSEMGRRGRAAAARFSWPAVAERMEEVYQEIVSARGRG